MFDALLSTARSTGWRRYTVKNRTPSTVLKTVLEQLRLSRHAPDGYPRKETRWHAAAVTFIRLIFPASHRHC